MDSGHDWDEVARDAQLANQIAERVPVLKAAKLNEVGGQAHPLILATKGKRVLAVVQQVLL
jgi:hypothetical protein